MISVLYVDDEPLLLDIAKIFLEKEGQFSIDAVLSAPAALALLNSKAYDAIISDYQMTDMDGIAFLKEVRSRFSDIPFILFTGKGREDVVIEAINYGVDFYLQKGGEPQAQFAELGHKIKNAVERRRAAGDLRDSEQRLTDIINFLPDATFAIDTEGTVIAWNRTIEEMTGIPAAEMLGKGDYAYSLPIYGIRRRILIDLIRDSEEVIREGRYAIIRKEGNMLLAETAAARPRGQEKIFLCKASLLFNKAGDVAGAIETIRDITEQKKAAEELRAAYDQLAASEKELRSQYDELAKSGQRIRESESRFRKLAELLPQIVFEMDRHFRITFVNRHAYPMLGFSPDEIAAGFSALSVIDPAQHLRIRENVGKMLKNEPLEHPEYTFIRKDGTSFPALIYADPVYSNGELTGFRGVVVDITERKRAEAALRESEEKYRTLVEHSQDGVIIVQDEHIVFANQTLSTMIGYTEQELSGHSVEEFIAPEDLGMVMARHRDRMSGKDVPESYEFSLLHKDGKTRVLTKMSAGIGTYRGSPALIGTFHDITEERRREVALRESEEQYVLLFEHANDGITIIQDGVIIRVNSRFAAMLGYTADELAGRSIRTVIHPDDQVLVVDRHCKRIAGEKGLPPVYTFRLVTRQGVPVWVELNTTLIDWHGRPATLNIIRDITNRKRAEDAIRETNRKMNLLSSVTRHDILNKVTVMSGYLALAKEKSDNPVMNEFIAKLESATRSISSHIEFTRIYQDLGTTEPAWHDIPVVLSALPVSNHLSFSADVGGVLVYADPLLEKVFSNLLDNTLRHGEHATAIRVSANETPGGLAIIWEDDGVGIAAHEKENIFQQGYGRNTGLGLFLSREILSITGMTIRETGEPGRSARFEITVPQGSYRLRQGM